MNTLRRRLGPLLAMPILLHCGPETAPEPGLDPEETFTAFCEALFACRDEESAFLYGSQEGCEDAHRMNYEDRSPLCQEHVLALEDCLSMLTCDEIQDYVDATGSACDDERSRLGEAGCSAL